MVTHRIRSEYMRRFREPRWETYSCCYEELLRYRKGRRLLEHAHSAWFWGGSDAESQPSRSPSPCGGAGGEEAREGGVEEPDCSLLRVPHLPLPLDMQQAEERKSPHTPAANGADTLAFGEEEKEEQEEEQRVCSRSSKVASLLPVDTRQDGEEVAPRRPRAVQRRRGRVGPAPPGTSREGGGGVRHPFALYGWGERKADMASRKTHNVGPAPSTNEIHESALRAKTRREVERQIQSQQAERRRAKSADQKQPKARTAPEFNPWVTEYMHCFSRSR